MPQRVTRIFREQNATLPDTYTLPPNLDMEFASVRAKINGAAASGAFIVVLEALSDDGQVVAQSRIDQEFAVGDTAAVTFAPF